MQKVPFKGPEPSISWRTGMSYREMGGMRSGMASIQDSAYIQARQQQIQSNLGDGVFRYMAVDREGVTITGASRNIGGKLVNSKNGTFTSIDTDVLDYEYEREQEVEAEIDKVMKYCIVNDNMTKRVLDFSDGQFKSVFEKKTDEIAGKLFNSPVNMPTSLSIFDCRPSYLKLLPSDSKELSGGLAKLRMIVSYNMPILEDGTPDSVIKRRNGLEKFLPASEALAVGASSGGAGIN